MSSALHGEFPQGRHEECLRGKSVRGTAKIYIRLSRLQENPLQSDGMGSNKSRVLYEWEEQYNVKELQQN